MNSYIHPAQRIYYILIEGQRRGPIRGNELARELPTCRTPVWRPGLANWVRLEDLPERGELVELGAQLSRGGPTRGDKTRSDPGSGKTGTRTEANAPAPDSHEGLGSIVVGLVLLATLSRSPLASRAFHILTTGRDPGRPTTLPVAPPAAPPAWAAPR